MLRLVGEPSMVEMASGILDVERAGVSTMFDVLYPRNPFVVQASSDSRPPQPGDITIELSGTEVPIVQRIDIR